MDTYIQIEGLCKAFDRQVIFDQFNLTLPQGETISIFGANGCGKSTLINLLSGLLKSDRGTLTIAQKPPQRTRIGYVFQNYRDSLFPWLTVRDNLLYPLKLQSISQQHCQQRLEQLITSFDLTLDLSRYPYQFSGGQQQLIALLRSLITIPDILLLDEPFASLDLEMTLYIRDKLEQFCLEHHLTTIMVSHDLDDAIYLADRILMFSQASTQYPTRILAQIPFNLPHPRTPEVLTHPEFIKTKARCLQLFRQESHR